MKKLNIVIPMAGEGSRFKKAGYERPKPFINVDGKIMIERVIDNLIIPNRELCFIFICRKEHIDEYGTSYFDNIFKENKIDYKIITVDKLTEGATCTVLKSRDFINNEDELLIANSDQIIDWSKEHFINIIDTYENDGAVLTFHSDSPKWSFAKVNLEGYIELIKEKEVISNVATVGIYHFKRGKDFVEGADEMIHKDIRVNGEFYVAPVYNELIYPKGLKIINYPIPTCAMHGLGIPEDLLKYLEFIRK